MDTEDQCDTPLRPNRFSTYRKQRIVSDGLQGPLRAIRLFILAILLPGILIAGPIYLRFRVYDSQIYPIGMTDMRLIDNKISTTWCQRQTVRSNATFNAFLMPDLPQLDSKLTKVSMTRELLLNDDMKEYWGFYLLKGSIVTVSTCVRWPGASLILLRGHKNLHECAYIGDDSSEELEELMALAAENGINTKSHTIDNPSNNPSLLRKTNTDVKFHDPNVNKLENFKTISPKQNLIDDNEINAKEMRNLLNKINEKADSHKPSIIGNGKHTTLKEWNKHKHHQTYDNIHKERVPNIGNYEENNLKFANNLTNSQIKNQTSTEVLMEVVKKLEQLGPRGVKVLEELNLKINKTSIREKRQITLKTALDLNSEEIENENLGIEQGFVPDEHADHHEIISENTLNDHSNSEFWSSFSSSEEALLNCAGLILSLPLSPHRLCEKERNEKEFATAGLSNTITYTVPINGYYFFVFNSENEIQENYIRTQFTLLKTVYNTTDSIKICKNETKTCSLPLNFFSSEKVVFEMPFSHDDSLWNDEFIVVSECEPRTIIYIICVLLVPLIILLFAFQ